MPRPIRTTLPRPPRRRLRLRGPAAWWPPVSARQDEAFRNIWQALRQHGQVQAVTLGSEKIQDRADTFVVCAIRLPRDKTASALKPLRAALSEFPFVRLAPAESLAITIQELGFLVDEPQRIDEISQERIEEFVHHSSTPVCDFPRFEIRVGGFNSFLDTPFLDVHDDGWCFRMHHRLRDFTLLPVADDYAYLPHVPLGYYTRDETMRGFPARMARWRDRTFVMFHAEALELLAIATADPFSEPEILHRFDLGHSLGPAETITQRGPSDVFV
ncbi:MAG TPA: 2'-5' RNA ligase family protein [Thermomicrobiales bacterium]|nr:2'-5' RNA ligase family protein [Thermomicrobiales bacterium]